MKLNIIGGIYNFFFSKVLFVNPSINEIINLIGLPGAKENNSQNLTINSNNTNINIPFDTSMGYTHVIGRESLYEHVYANPQKSWINVEASNSIIDDIIY